MVERTEGALASARVRAGVIDTDILIDVLRGVGDCNSFYTNSSPRSGRENVAQGEAPAEPWVHGPLNPSP